MKYKIGDKLEGRCHIGIDTSNNTKVALKLVNKTIYIPKWVREFEIQSLLSHKNIVKMFDLDETECFKIYVMEYCSGGSLFRMVQNTEHGLLLPKVSKYTSHVTDALEYLHGRKVAHLDVKLGNVFVDSNDNAKLGDFGFAMSFSDLTKLTEMVGTPNYLSPEMLQRREPTSAVDIWALGCMVYAMCNKCPPFETLSIKLTSKRILRGEYDKFNVPTDVSKFVVACLNPDPTDRPTAQELKECFDLLDFKKYTLASGDAVTSLAACLEHQLTLESSSSDKVMVSPEQ